MHINPFYLERYFAQYEFSVPYQLSPSDCEPLQMQELLHMAGQEDRKQWEQLSLGYTESQGHPGLRERIAQLYRGLDADSALVLAPEEGIFIAMHSLLQTGDHVITTFPAYQSLYEVARALGCQVEGWMPRKGNHWEFHPEDLKALVQPKTRLLVLNFPHNPTGASLTPETFRALVRWAGERGIAVFSDEMYRFLEPEGTPPLPAACELSPAAVSLGGLSKSLSLPGLRIGWLVSQDRDFLQKAANFKDYTTICSSAPSERLAIIALKNREKIWKRNRRIIADNLQELDAFFTRYAGVFRWMPPQAGPVAFPELLAELPVETFCARSVNEPGVMVLPATVYEYPGNHFRISAARRNMPEVLAVWEKWLQQVL